MDNAGLAQEVSEGKNVSKWSRDHCCGIFSRTMESFCPCPMNLLEAELNSFCLISRTEKISSVYRINCVTYCQCLFLYSSVVEKSKQHKREIQNVQHGERTGAPGNVILVPSLCSRRQKQPCLSACQHTGSSGSPALTLWYWINSQHILPRDIFFLGSIICNVHNLECPQPLLNSLVLPFLTGVRVSLNTPDCLQS